MKNRPLPQFGTSELPEFQQKVLDDLEKIKELQAQQIDAPTCNEVCNNILQDCCVVELPLDSIQSLPNIGSLINITYDSFFLECCIDTCSLPTGAPVVTPCGQTIQPTVLVDQVKAIGHLNYRASFNATTYFDNGANNCNGVVTQNFTCIGTVPANHTLCYAPAGTGTCPDFCNNNIFGFGFISDIVLCDTKVFVILHAVFVLPACP